MSLIDKTLPQVAVVVSDIWKYIDRRLTFIKPTDTIRHSNDDEKTTTAVSPVKLKEIYVLVPGFYRVKWDMRISDPAYSVSGRIYVNGSATDIWFGYSGTGYSTFSGELFLGYGDKVQLYGYVTGATGYFRNFRLCGDPLDAFGYNLLT
jgi:hypothetical protein